MVPPVGGIFGCFGGAVCTLFPPFSFFLLLNIPQIRNQWKATGLHGEDADSAGCQHSQPGQSSKRQLPITAAGPVDYQRWLAGLPQVPKIFPTKSIVNRAHFFD